jgi:hypothetical protein
MCVRFRRQVNRLQASLIETRRVGGKIVAERYRCARLGRHRHLHPRALRVLGQAPRVPHQSRQPRRPHEHAKLYAALSARIPMVTSDEQCAIQLENAKDEEQFWGAMRDMNAATAEDSIRLIALAEAKLNEHKRAAAHTVEQCEAARERLANLKRDESVSGGFGKSLTSSRD